MDHILFNVTGQLKWLNLIQVLEGEGNVQCIKLCKWVSLSGVSTYIQQIVHINFAEKSTNLETISQN